jgi:hypothetical protein
MPVARENNLVSPVVLSKKIERWSLVERGTSRVSYRCSCLRHVAQALRSGGLKGQAQ